MLYGVFFTISSSTSEFPTYCFFIELAGIEDVFQMLGDGAPALVEKHADQLLRQPDRFVRDTHFDAVLARLPGEDQKFRGAVADLEFLHVI